MIRALLDANVIYPAPLRDLLFSIAAEEVFQPLWTKQINEEWVKNLLQNRPDISRSQLQRTCDLMDKAFPMALIEGYENLISMLELPDSDDRHVLAAAIKSEADILVTFNLKDFQQGYINQFGVEVKHPDHFLCTLFERKPNSCVTAFKKMHNRLKHPPIPKGKLLDTLKVNDIKQFPALLKPLL